MPYVFPSELRHGLTVAIGRTSYPQRSGRSQHEHLAHRPRAHRPPPDRVPSNHQTPIGPHRTGRKDIFPQGTHHGRTIQLEGKQNGCQGFQVASQRRVGEAGRRAVLEKHQEHVGRAMNPARSKLMLKFIRHGNSCKDMYCLRKFPLCNIVYHHCHNVRHI
jgi:hypothetical protein